MAVEELEASECQSGGASMRVGQPWGPHPPLGSLEELEVCAGCEPGVTSMDLPTNDTSGV